MSVSNPDAPAINRANAIPSRHRVRSRTARWFAWHGVLGIWSGTCLLLVSLSGAIAVLSYEIDWLLRPALRVPAVTDIHAAEPLVRALQTVAARYPDWAIEAIAAPHWATHAIEIVCRRPGGEGTGFLERVYVAPQDGRITGTAGYMNVQRVLRSFHFTLFGGRPGMWMAYSMGLAMAGSVITGLFLYPMWWRNLFTLRWRKDGRVVFGDIHRFVGAWSLAFSLLMAVTSVHYFVEIARAQIEGEWPGEKPPKLSAERLAAVSADASPLSVEALLSRAIAAAPDFKITRVYFPKSEQAIFSVYGEGSAMLTRPGADRIDLDAYSGDILRVDRARDWGAWRRWDEAMNDLHYGTFGGLPVKILWCVLGLTIPALIVTGGYLSLRRANFQTSEARSWWMAGAVSLAVVLIVAALTIQEMRLYFSERAQLPNKNHESSAR